VKSPKDSVLWHQSGVAPTGEPFVQLLRDEEVIAQMSPEQARDHARAITEAAEAAEQDAFLVSFAREQIGLPLEEAGKILIAFREYRARATGKSQGPTRPKDWVMPSPDKMPDYYFKKPKKDEPPK
jgi:hypothetical protein